MKKAAGVFLFLFILIPGINSYCWISHSVLPTRCISIVLKINGEGNDIYSFEPYNFSLSTGIIKEKYLSKPSSSINIIVQNENDELVFDGYFDNPLSRLIESFEPDGTIKRIDLKQTSDYINLRFPVVDNVKKISVKCYRFTPSHDKILISEFKLDLQ